MQGLWFPASRFQGVYGFYTGVPGHRAERFGLRACRLRLRAYVKIGGLRVPAF